MDSQALRALQAPLKETYKQNPNAALVTLKARGKLDDLAIACKVETGRALAVAGLHPATGGTGGRDLLGGYVARGVGGLRGRDAQGGFDRARDPAAQRNGSRRG